VTFRLQFHKQQTTYANKQDTCILALYVHTDKLISTET